MFTQTLYIKPSYLQTKELKLTFLDLLQISEENGFLKKLYYPIIRIIITITLIIAKRKRNSIQLLFIIKRMNVVQLLSGVCLEKLEREHKYLQ